MIIKLLKNPLFFAPTALIATVAVYLIIANTDGVSFESAPAERRTLIEEVSVTGRVKPAESVDLGFEISGRIAAINANIGQRVVAGQILIQLNSADARAQLEESQASLLAEQAKLDELKKGGRPEEIEIQKAKVNDARQVLATAILDGYADADDAVRNKIDQFINNPSSLNPSLSVLINNAPLKSDLESNRVSVEQILNEWKSNLKNFSVNADLKPYAESAIANLEKIKAFVEKVALAVNSATADAQTTQATLDSYRADTATARANVNNAISETNNAALDLATAERELELKIAGSTPEAIRAQEAKVLNAQAGVSKAQAQLAKTILRSPISGTVTRQDGKVGEIAAANQFMVAIISEDDFKIEAHIPEADIAKIDIGDSAVIALDAYGEDVLFQATVIAINPAETIIEGVPTYKTTLRFTEEDSRIRSGMTANIDIITAIKENALVIPRRAIISNNGEKTIRLLIGGNFEEIPVETGLVDREGFIEIISGLMDGDRVVTFVKK